MKIVISSGHGKYVRGASGYIDEVNEARLVVEQVAKELRKINVEVITYHDDVSQSQNENLNRIVDFHNSQKRDLDVSVHFNAYERTEKPMGTECLYVTQEELAEAISNAIADSAGFINRGPKKRTDLFFLNNTAAPAILIETCFVDSMVDAELYEGYFIDICRAIAVTLKGDENEIPETKPLPETLVDKIIEVAMNSTVASYEWKDRGLAPPGYIQGMALSFASCMLKYFNGNTSVVEMAKADTGYPDVDVLSWYADEFKELKMYNDKDGIATLRHLFVLMLGLGMRESSGRHCAGRDMSADNVSADTAEAGLFQTSWNINTCSDEILNVMGYWSVAYENESTQCFSEVFERGVECDSSDWSSYGSGTGRTYQDLAKECPPSTVEITAIGLRNRRQHWGPVNRKEVEILVEADEMFKEIGALGPCGIESLEEA